MRVISGDLKGHPIKAVPNMKTRPTTDKVKESLFHQIGPYFGGGQALDLFAGSGNLGIEAISRGIDHVVFVDQQYQAIQTIRENVKNLKIENRCEIYRNDAFRAIKAAGKRGKQFDYVFLDPPYNKVSFNKLFELIQEHNLIKTGSIVICEHSQVEVLPTHLDGYEIIKHDTYSDLIGLTVYRYH
ncbi:16S rRNA (guanine(966)-N(2))-methyltransferase RsmD [Alkalibacillus aidingensis]|uniref:16S rRNA (guanine(966)-N(2))-methyltransferase RsmD n=1 Tax=Alkalibacillus aidingensis TaxID=2747607 RepID=UPI00166115C3|nr:16S rRNA (guanine(966)-N(2))-methyltransferase RsmD [Alkalibacillus aidingensis]